MRPTPRRAIWYGRSLVSAHRLAVAGPERRPSAPGLARYTDGDRVDQRRLARAVGPDEGEQLAAVRRRRRRLSTASRPAEADREVADRRGSSSPTAVVDGARPACRRHRRHLREPLGGGDEVGRGLAATEVQVLHQRVVHQLVARSVEDDPAELDHVAVLRVLQGQPGVLLDHQHADAVGAHLAEQLEQLRDDHRRQAERQLVAHAGTAAGPSAPGRPRPSAARRPTGSRRSACAARRAGGTASNTRSTLALISPRSLRVAAPHSRFSSTVRRGNSLRPSGTWATPAWTMSRLDSPTELPAVERDRAGDSTRPRCSAEQAGDRPHQRGLAGAVGAEHRDEPARRHAAAETPRRAMTLP